MNKRIDPAELEAVELEQLIATQSDGGMVLSSEQHVPMTEKIVRENPNTLWCHFPHLD